ncbi:clavesin-1 [Galendromus occidentalis]|uniref:Clavesin-1 n=1 Tax=Galendromus occidentalis TaxID=34638 RepID=A0AAJ6VUV7_9ACAR|nr:clavesin-1 [Galendromus occidentalis]
MTVNILNGLREEHKLWPWEEKARQELNENPDATDGLLLDLKEKIKEYSIEMKNFRPRTDDEFLMAFLRSRKFDLQKTFNGYCKFHKIRLCNPQKIFPVGRGPKHYSRVYTNPIGTIADRRNPLDGTTVFIWSFRNFDASKDEYEDVFNASYQVITELILDPSIQTYGFRFVFDLTGLNYWIVAALLSRFYLNKAILMAQGSSPMRFKGFHVINGPARATRMVFQAFRPLLPKKMLERVHFHDSCEQLHAFVSPSILPDTLGGETGPWSGLRLKEAMDQLNDKIVQQTYFGFISL